MKQEEHTQMKQQTLSPQFRLLLIVGLSTIILEPWTRSTRDGSKSFVSGLETKDLGELGQSGSPHRLKEHNRPNVYTFFHGVSNRTFNTGMTHEADEKLLETWRSEWSRNGWNAVVLNLNDAKRHKDYEAVNALLEGGPFGEYDRYCFLRWLALAAAGGGFASDYDTFPLNYVTYALPNEGKLTIHEESGDGGVPSVVSGTAEEYTRFAWLLARNSAAHKSESHWSDMKAMQDVYKSSNGKEYLMLGNVINALDLLTGKGIDEETCKMVAGKRAIHFSHYSIQFGKVPPGTTAQDRESIGQQWLQDWRKICLKEDPLPVTEAVVAVQPVSAKIDEATTLVGKQGQETPQPKGQFGLKAMPSRPRVYAFVGHADASTLSVEEQAMLKVWLKSWFEIGWEPQVLFYDAAAKHADYAKLYNDLTSISKTVTPQVFIRYLAMANVGGGWLSDFDLIPLSNFAERLLPNGGKFTVHESTKDGNGLPSLVSGSADEYLRMATAIVENSKSHGESTSWDDIQSLQEIYRSSSGAAYSVVSNVVAGKDVLQGRAVDRWTCSLLESIYAVHASPEAFQNDANKAKTARDWVLSWRKKCLREEDIPTIEL